MKLHHCDANGIDRSCCIYTANNRGWTEKGGWTEKEGWTKRGFDSKGRLLKLLSSRNSCVFIRYNSLFVALHPNSGPCNSQIICLFLTKLMFICPRSVPCYCLEALRMLQYQGVLDFLAKWWQSFMLRRSLFNAARSASLKEVCAVDLK